MSYLSVTLMCLGPEELVKFLDFVKADLEESTKDFEDDFVNSLQKSVQTIKENRKWEEHFMGWYDVMQDEMAEARAEGRAEGRAEVVFELLEDLGEVPEELRTKIMSETDLDLLSRWTKLAAKADSLEQFLKEM